MNNDDVIRMRHMADAAREAIGFAAGRTRADLDIDRMLVCILDGHSLLHGDRDYDPFEKLLGLQVVHP